VLSVQGAVNALVAARAHAPADTVGVLTMSGMALWPVRAADYRLLGLMGGAGSIGLGIAIGRPDLPVWVVDGDGSLLMSLGVLAAIADAAPANLTHVVIDNGVYAVSGAQPTPRVRHWDELFLAAGYRSATTCHDATEVAAALEGAALEGAALEGGRLGAGPHAVVVVCSPERPAYPPRAFAPRPTEASRFRTFLQDWPAPRAAATAPPPA
jgi:phosphonopyruvate decarboxylase